MSTPTYDQYNEQLILDGSCAPGGVLVHYADGAQEIVHINAYVVNLLGCGSVAEALDCMGGCLSGFVSAEDLGTVQSTLQMQAAREEGMRHLRYRIHTTTGDPVTVDDYGRLVKREGERPVRYASIYAAVQEHPTDWLTGLPSMSHFHELAQTACAEMEASGGQPIALALNLMGMKAFNARHGREKGDEVLRTFADALLRHFGSGCCSRFAEDHFYAYCEMGELWLRVNGLFDDFAQNEAHVSMPVRVGAYACEEGDDIVAIGFDRAKLACDLDRKTWKSHVTWFTNEMREGQRRRIYLLSNLDRAMREGWVRPHYQSIVRAATGDVCGEEALARWSDPTYGDLLPREFFSVIDEAGLSFQLDMHIVDCVLEDIAEKRRQGVSVVPVSVNISTQDLRQIDVPAQLSSRLDALGIDHNLVRVELSESTSTFNISFVKRQIELLHREGFEVWMDDFGSGYSPINVLHELDFDLIKLDTSLLREQGGSRLHPIIEGIVQTAGKMGIGTIAEGVETKEQAVFLEQVGCDMLQGYYFDGPQSLSEVVEKAHTSADAHREAVGEADYWESVSLLNLVGFSTMMDSQSVDGIPTAEFPAGVLERRQGAWRAIRTNRSMRDLLVREGMLPKGQSSLEAAAITVAEDFAEFGPAVERCMESQAWERIPGGLEYGTGFQFYVRPIASSRQANAFMVMGIPTLLGTALGAYGDVPVAYAVFRVILSDAGDEVLDTQYVYANAMYCDWGGYDQKEIVGKSSKAMSNTENDDWFSYCYRAAVLGEHVHDVVYSPTIKHWLSFYIAPSSIPGYCVYAFAMADDEHRERAEMIVSRNTSDLIIDIANDMYGEPKYQKAMGQLLERMSQIIHPDRLYIFERGETTTSNTFEWCAPGVASGMAGRQDIPNEDFDSWSDILARDSMALVPDVSKLRDVDLHLHKRLDDKGVHRMVVVPCYGDGGTVGYLGADNYAFDEDLDTRRLLKTIASFVGSKIANHKLVDTLEAASMRDGLTGLLNRRGVDTAVAEHLASAPGEPYALALIDIDDFKTVNDLYGHNVGDEALRELAHIIVRMFPEGTIMGRNGGDEFLAMVVGDDVRDAHRILSEFSSSEKYCGLDGKRYPLSTSIGYACYPQDADSLQLAYSRADAALYSVKLSGKSGCQQYAPQMETQYRSQLGFTPRDIAESVPGAIVVHKSAGDGEILFANEELVRLFECDDLGDFMAYVKGSYKNVIHPDDRDRVKSELMQQRAFDEVGRKDFVDFRILTKRGNVRHVGNNGRLMEIEGMGKVLYELIIDYDERK
ncbi:MAG: EAL domain-containing protein [Coriobacteriales bacterium]|nr:EAL domain-containing protein [Coriobacteriales bacterium]